MTAPWQCHERTYQFNHSVTAVSWGVRVSIAMKSPWRLMEANHEWGSSYGSPSIAVRLCGVPWRCHDRCKLHLSWKAMALPWRMAWQLSCAFKAVPWRGRGRSLYVCSTMEQSDNVR